VTLGVVLVEGLTGSGDETVDVDPLSCVEVEFAVLVELVSSVECELLSM